VSYKKDLTMRIVRTKHIIEFYNNTRAMDLMADLANVPKEARLVEVCEACNDGEVIIKGASRPHSPHKLVFELEEEQK